MVDNAFSKKITVLSFIAMVAVVMIHSQTVAAIENTPHWIACIQRFIFSRLTSWAVPFFFMLSGYNFGRFATRDRKNYKDFYIKKYHTLFIPYMAWITIGTLLTLPLIILCNYIGHRPLLTNTVLGYGSIWECFVKFIGLYGAPMGNFPLWYMRSLMLVFLFAPAIVLLLNRGRRCLSMAIGLLLCLVPNDYSIPLLNLRYSTLGYFVFGASLYGFQCSLGSRHLLVFAVVGWIGLSIARLLGVEFVANVAEPLLGILAIYCIYEQIDARIIVRPYMRRTFWVYCFHNAATNYCLSFGFLIGGKNTITLIVLPIITSVVGVGISLAVAFICERYWKRGYDVLTGGRG